jgi:6-phosphogluconolactonase
VFPDARALVRAAAAEVLRRGRRAVRERGAFHLALAGGNTPMALYQVLGSGTRARAALWHQTHLYWGDERAVPPEDAASNYGVAWKVGLQRLAVPAGNVHRIIGESEDARRAAVLYESELRTQFAGAAWPRFDLVLLGLGADGHTASLFPGSDTLDERERWTEVAVGGDPPRRTSCSSSRAAARPPHWGVSSAFPVSRRCPPSESSRAESGSSSPTARRWARAPPAEKEARARRRQSPTGPCTTHLLR